MGLDTGYLLGHGACTSHKPLCGLGGRSPQAAAAATGASGSSTRTGAAAAAARKPHVLLYVAPGASEGKAGLHAAVGAGKQLQVTGGAGKKFQVVGVLVVDTMHVTGCRSVSIPASERAASGLMCTAEISHAGDHSDNKGALPETEALTSGAGAAAAGTTEVAVAEKVPAVAHSNNTGCCRKLACASRPKASVVGILPGARRDEGMKEGDEEGGESVQTACGDGSDCGVGVIGAGPLQTGGDEASQAASRAGNGGKRVVEGAWVVSDGVGDGCGGAGGGEQAAAERPLKRQKSASGRGDEATAVPLETSSAAKGCSAQLGVRCVWVASALRRRRVATRLLGFARFVRSDFGLEVCTPWGVQIGPCGSCPCDMHRLHPKASEQRHSDEEHLGFDPQQ
jgi:hypothetical protein